MISAPQRKFRFYAFTLTCVLICIQLGVASDASYIELTDGNEDSVASMFICFTSGHFGVSF